MFDDAPAGSASADPHFISQTFSRSESAHPPLLASEFPSLVRLSFASTDGYFRGGGQPVIADHSADSAPHDLAVAGISLPHDLGRAGRVVAAWVVNSPTPSIRATLSIPSSNPCRTFIRAFADNQPRIPETEIKFLAGRAQMDLRVLGLSTDRVQVIDEKWTFENRIVGTAFTPMHFHVGGMSTATLPIRIYVTAAAPINAVPRESYYHLATAVPGAQDSARVLRDIWSHFTSFRSGGHLTNAAGQRLGFWRDRKPGLDQADFIARSAQDLITASDSSCRGWAELFHEVLAIHGIHSTVRAIRPKLSRVVPQLGLPSFMVPDGRGGKTVTRTVGILVARFRWKPADQLSPQPFTVKDGELHTARFIWKLNNPVDPHAAQWPDPDVIDLLRPSHGVESTRGIFGNHAVVLVQNGSEESWYDPSFGLGPFGSLLEYEDGLLGRGEPNPGGLFAIVGWKRREKLDSDAGQLDQSSAGLLLGAAPAPPGPMLEAVDPG